MENIPAHPPRMVLLCEGACGAHLLCTNPNGPSKPTSPSPPSYRTVGSRDLFSNINPLDFWATDLRVRGIELNWTLISGFSLESHDLCGPSRIHLTQYRAKWMHRKKKKKKTYIFFFFFSLFYFHDSVVWLPWLLYLRQEEKDDNVDDDEVVGKDKVDDDVHVCFILVLLFIFLRVSFCYIYRMHFD